MAAPGPPLCACSNIALMQLFHELKAQFPTVPDATVSSTIASHCHDKRACRERLRDEAAHCAPHVYPLHEPPGPHPAPPPPRACPNALRPRRPDDDCTACDSDAHNYKISRISKVRCELNRKLEEDDNASSLEENYTRNEDSTETFDVDRVKPKRPDTLRISPGIGYVDEDKIRSSRDKTEFDPDDFNKCRIRDKSESDGRELQRLQSGTDVGISNDYPFNVSLNLSCRMDVPQMSQRRQSQPDQNQNNYYSPGAYTSVNLTVCTPTSIQNFPMDDNCSIPQNLQSTSNEQRPRGFEGNLQITVNSAPTSSTSPDSKLTHRQTTALDVAESPSTSLVENVVRRQKIHLDRLDRALKADRLRLATMHREIRYLQAAPPPSPSTARLRQTVHQLHVSCEKLTQQLDEAPRHPGGSDETSGRGAAGNERRDADGERQNWKCHICTFINHAGVNQCELCMMPRIILGRTGAPVPQEISNASES